MKNIRKYNIYIHARESILQIYVATKLSCGSLSNTVVMNGFPISFSKQLLITITLFLRSTSDELVHSD